MSNQELILEKLGYYKLFKYEIKKIWGALSSAGCDNTNTVIMPSFTIVLPPSLQDLPKMYLTFPYIWSLDTCGIVEKVKDYLIFGVDLNKFKIDISGIEIRKQLVSNLQYEYHGNRLEIMKTNNHLSFYNFCKNTLGHPDDHYIYDKDYQEFFNTVEFSNMVNTCKDYAEKAWGLNKPLKCSIDGIPDNVLPLVYYSIPRRECYYLSKMAVRRFFAYKIKLDLRILQGANFRYESIDRINKIRAGFPRNPISNYRYEFA